MMMVSESDTELSQLNDVSRHLNLGIGQVSVRGHIMTEHEIKRIIASCIDSTDPETAIQSIEVIVDCNIVCMQ